MPNGRLGDYPFTDIIVHRRAVYSARVDDLVRRVAKLSSDAQCRQLADMLIQEFNEYSDPDLPELERRLVALLDQREVEAKMRGWEVQ